MSLNACLGGFLGLALLMVAATSAQQSEPAAPPNGGRIDLDVVVTPKSGPPVGDLQQQDFTVLDNKVPRPIASFRAVNGRNAPVEIVLVIDAVNANYTSVSYQRAQIEKFLRADEGRIARPIALAIFTDQGSRIVGNFSTDGNALSAELDREDVALRSVERSTGFWGATERWQISLQAMTQLITTVASDPGRKIVICISPGWPLLSGPRVQLSSKMQRQIFGDVVNLSTQMRRGRVTLYSVDPFGPGESMIRTFYYEEFLKGISKPSQALPGDLGLQVLAVQSGGLAIAAGNDIVGDLQQCLGNVAPYYEISFDPAPATQADPYHQLEIKIAKSGLIARTRQGYYSRHSLRE
ncbi:MAG: VWA domain-containing protein [Candidatus Acidiferrales bacterium]